MKSIIEIAGQTFLLPADDAMKVMKLMARAMPVNKSYRSAEEQRATFGIREGDWRNHWVLDGRSQPNLSVEIVSDDQVHIPKELAEDPGTEITPKPARRGNRLRAHRQQLLLGNGGGQ